jgi:hypothetical protein
MRGIAYHPHAGRPDIAWLLPFTVLVLVVAGAIGSLVAGLPDPQTIGADGLAGVVIVAP